MARLSRYAPPLVLMAVIYVLSDQPGLSSGLGPIDLVLRKLAHMVEYGLLWFLLLRAARYRRPALAAVLAVAYAASDEWHQSTVDGRVGTPIDVGIDALGVALAWIAWSRWRDGRRARRPSDPAAATASRAPSP